MEYTGFKRRTTRFETADVASALLMLDYVTVIFNIYNLLDFLGDFPH